MRILKKDGSTMITLVTMITIFKLEKTILAEPIKKNGLVKNGLRLNWGLRKLLEIVHVFLLKLLQKL